MERFENVLWKVVGEILGAGIGLFVINNLLSWPIPFITSRFALYVPIANMAIVLTTILKIAYHALSWTRFRFVFLVGSHLVGIWSLSNLATIFPFDFSVLGINFLNPLVHLSLIIAVFALSIAIIVDVVRIFFQR